ncbi:hypothetical protein ACFY7Y_04100 [Streptomyces virginiae]|uniref:hypothetical protein n=1 Tax=Streptomyces virginiae TaxID=1961 RepID=UPI0036C831A0
MSISTRVATCHPRPRIRYGIDTSTLCHAAVRPTVLIGHFDTACGPAVLKDVPRVRTGDEITVSRAGDVIPYADLVG